MMSPNPHATGELVEAPNGVEVIVDRTEFGWEACTILPGGEMLHYQGVMLWVVFQNILEDLKQRELT